MSVFQALSAGKGTAPFRWAPRPGWRHAGRHGSHAVLGDGRRRCSRRRSRRTRGLRRTAAAGRQPDQQGHQQPCRQVANRRIGMTCPCALGEWIGHGTSPWRVWLHVAARHLARAYKRMRADLPGVTWRHRCAIAGRCGIVHNRRLPSPWKPLCPAIPRTGTAQPGLHRGRHRVRPDRHGRVLARQKAQRRSTRWWGVALMFYPTPSRPPGCCMPWARPCAWAGGGMCSAGDGGSGRSAPRFRPVLPAPPHARA